MVHFVLVGLEVVRLRLKVLFNPQKPDLGLSVGIYNYGSLFNINYVSNLSESVLDSPTIVVCLTTLSGQK